MEMMIFLMGLIAMLMNYKSYLMMLISLEIMMLPIYSSLVSHSSTNQMSSSIIMLFLAMMVCEGAFGLALLVKINQPNSNDLSLNNLMN